MKARLIVPILVSSLALAGCSSSYTTPTPTPVTQQAPATPAVMTGPKVITLNTQNNLGQSGTATLTEANGKVMVSLMLTGGKFTAAQPAHIHLGSCPNPGAVKYPLTDVVNGKSETTLPVDMKTLLAEGKLAVNVHKSAAEAKVYTACGDLN